MSASVAGNILRPSKFSAEFFKGLRVGWFCITTDFVSKCKMRLAQSIAIARIAAKLLPVREFDARYQRQEADE
ncbi:hypothetical protein ACETU7_08095 [Rhodococcus sp. 3Y1]